MLFTKKHLNVVLMSNWYKINSSDEGRFIFGTGIDKPVFLMLTEARMSTIPTDFHGRLARVE